MQSWWAKYPKLDSTVRVIEQWWLRWLCMFCARFRNDNGNECVPYLDLANRNVNLNWLDNDWNENDSFGRSRNHFYSPAFGGSFSSNFLIQPPIMRPISFNFSESAAYCLVFKACISQAMRKKNLSESKLAEAF